MQKVFSHHNPQNKIASTDKCQNYAAISGTDHQKSDGGGGFSACTIFCFRPLLMKEFFLQVKPSVGIFFFSDKYCFVCYLLIKKNYFTKELLFFVGFNYN